MNNVNILTVKEVSRLLRLSRNSTYKGIKTGAIPHIRIGKRILIPEAALIKMLVQPEGQSTRYNEHQEDTRNERK